MMFAHRVVAWILAPEDGAEATLQLSQQTLRHICDYVLSPDLYR